MPLRVVLVAALAAVLLCGGAAAEDQPFLTLDTTDIEPQSGHELEQDANWAMGPASAAGLGLETELEYGLNDDLQIAAAADYGWDRSDSNADRFHFGSVGGEAIYRALNVDFDPVGLGVLVSADAGSALMDGTAKLLVQKNFLNDRLRMVVNSGWTEARQRTTNFTIPRWQNESMVELAAGFSYAITWSWSAGMEFDDDLTSDSNVYYAGPTVQFVAHPLTASVGFQAQLPWASGPAGLSDTVRNGFAADAERYRVAFRVTRDFW